MFPKLLSKAILLAAALFPIVAHAVVVIHDEFDTGTHTTGAIALPGTNWSTQGGTITQNPEGTLTFRTPGNNSQWDGSVVYTTVASPDLNFFQNTVTVSIRDLSLMGYGDHANPKSRFRFGLIGRDNEPYTSGSANGGNTFNQFYNNGNDGLSLNLVTTAAGVTTFDLRTKFNTLSTTDPNILPTGGTATLTFLAKHFDFSVNALGWSLHFWDDASNNATYTGTWNIAANESTWGNALDGWGNSAFIMGVQQMGEATISEPFDIFNGYTTATIGSVMVTSVPEPARGVLALAALTIIAFKRKRQNLIS